MLRAEEILINELDPRLDLIILSPQEMKPFAISRFPVSQRLWMNVMGENPSYFQHGSDFPVESVSWHDCQTFIEKLNTITGKNYRLPTVAEWEFAARGGGKDICYGKLDEIAWYAPNSDNKTHQIGQKSPNEYGLYDMLGNIFEWCQDEAGADRVLKGGCWFTNSFLMQEPGFHVRLNPDDKSYRQGLRLAANIASDLKARTVAQLRTDLGGVIPAAIPSPSTRFKPGSPQWLKNIGIEMVSVPSGSFNSGGDDAHIMNLNGFRMSHTPVTEGQWQEVMGKSSDDEGDYRRDCPKSNVNWEKALNFIQTLNTLTGRMFRLPTEVEWEYAARGLSDGELYGWIDDIAWCGEGEIPNAWPHPVARKKPNALGLFDMIGNVWEWCTDIIIGEENPEGATQDINHVIRGGAVNLPEQWLTVNSRAFCGEHETCSYLGLRLVEDLPLKESESPHYEPPLIGIERSHTTSVTKRRSLVSSDALDLMTIPEGNILLDGQLQYVRSFRLGATPVTQYLWQKVMMGNNPSRFQSDLYRPVERVSWYDCQRFLGRLNWITGQRFRLPTQIEWKYAAQGGRNDWFCGAASDLHIWHMGNTGASTQVVGKKISNPFGLYDMLGNVWEWCLDGMSLNFWQEIDQDNPLHHSTDACVFPAILGGSWREPIARCTPLLQNCNDPEERTDDIGFRLAIDGDE